MIVYPKSTWQTAYEQLVEAEGAHADTIEIVEVSTGKRGVANTDIQGRVWAFYGAFDGSDDKILSAVEFNAKFQITAIIF